MQAIIDYSLVVNQFVKRFVEDRMIALQWADKNIKPEMYPVLKPLIRDALKARGYTFGDET